MSASKRQMHLGVFVLGTGNHSAGWRYDGAFTTSCSLPVMKSIAGIAELAKGTGSSTPPTIGIPSVTRRPSTARAAG